MSDDTDFGWALAQLWHGLRVCRENWNGKGMYLEFHTPDEHSLLTQPYIFMRTADGDFVPWVASQSDLLMSDWELVHVK